MSPSNIYLLLFLLWKINISFCQIDIDTDDGDSNSDDDTLIISSITAAKRVNVHFNVTNNKNHSSAQPNPDITVLSQDYFLCIWSYIIKNEENNTYSNEIYSNLFSSRDGRSMVRKEYLLNRIRGKSQDTPSATALFNTSNKITHQVAVVWESQIMDDITHNTYDAVFGRIIRWNIQRRNNYRYVRVTSPSSKEFQISSPSIDYLHHRNPDVIPIYNTGKFLVSWISFDDNENLNYNMIFIRIYNNNGRPYSAQMQIHNTDLYWKKYPQSIPLLHNLTLIAWLTQSDNNNIDIYGMIFDEEGQNKVINNEGIYTFSTIADNIDHSIYDDTQPVVAHLHNDPHRNNNFFVLGYNSINEETETNTMYAAVYMYNSDSNSITQISDITTLFSQSFDSNSFLIQYPQMENIVNQLYELENGLNAKIALCYSLKDLILDKSDILCKIFEISLWDSGDNINADITIITQDVLINDISLAHHQHQHPSVSSESILRGQTDFSDDPQFIVVWSNSREGGYDVYTKILQVNHESDCDGDCDGQKGDNVIFGSHLNTIIIGVVFGIILVVLLICICNHFYIKHKNNLKLKPRRKMQQLGEESDDDDEEDTIAGYGHNTTKNPVQVHDDEDDGDGIQLTQRDSY